jgi:hypothetical protein
MARPNPGPFEPLIYFLQTPASFRIIGMGGLALFTLLFLYQAAHSGDRYVAYGLFLLAALWLESGSGPCRSCQHYGTWHCAGQGVAVSMLFAPRRTRISAPRAYLHVALASVYILYGLFWLWHAPLLGFLFTLWVPAAAISAIAPNGYSWLASDASRTTRVA